MKEMIIFIIFTSISITFEWTVYTDQQCSCQDLNLESECSSANCVWSNSYICQNVDCINLDQSQCLTYKESCAYNTETKSCASFDYCNALEGESTDDCSSQNLSCTWVSGSQCISLSDCSQFNQSNCPSTCYNDGSSCISFSQCSQINQQLCSTQNNCFWEGQCKSIQCSNYLSSDTCLFSQDQSSNVQPCLWKSDACVNAESQDVLNAQTCFANTAQMYHWAPKDQKKPEYYCKPCYQFLFTIQIVLITLLQ